MGQPAYFKSSAVGAALNLNLKVSLPLSFDGFHTGSSNDLPPFYLNRKKLFPLQDTSSGTMHYEQMAPESTCCNLGTDLLHSPSHGTETSTTQTRAQDLMAFTDDFTAKLVRENKKLSLYTAVKEWVAKPPGLYC